MNVPRSSIVDPIIDPIIDSVWWGPAGVVARRVV